MPLDLVSNQPKHARISACAIRGSTACLISGAFAFENRFQPGAKGKGKRQMALIVVVMSGLAGVLAALIALIGFDASFSQALALYLVVSIVPAALVMAGLFLHMQAARALTAQAAADRTGVRS